MSDQMKKTFSKVMYAIGAKQFHELRNMPVPEIERGNQQPNDIKVGDTVEALATSTRKEGSRGKVQEIYEQHGYWYYVCDNGMGTQRQQDIRKV